MPKLSVVLFALFTLSGCAGPDATVVEMTGNQKFDPEQLTISPGDAVSFKNTSSESHTVTAYSDGLPEGADYFSSGGLPSEEAARDELGAALVASGDGYEVTFDEPGTYRYFCVPHEGAGMTGSIVVE